MNPISEVVDPGQLRHGLGPIWAAARTANPDFTLSGPVTFRAPGLFAPAAVAWQESLFNPVLLPALRAALAHARRGEVRELAALDQRLSESLPAGVRDDSTRAGHRLALHGAALRGDRLLPRLAASVSDGTSPGHLAIVFAARCGAFSLPDRMAVGAYLFQEMCAGAPTAPVIDVCDFVARCLEPLGAIPALRAA
jgi:hypothetical protein